MKKRTKNLLYIIILVFLIISALFLFTTKSEAHEFSFKINTDSKIIYRVTPNTYYSVFLKNMKGQVTGEEDIVELYDNGNKISSGIVKTGMTLVRNYTENYDVAVLGDVTGDGLFNQIDLSYLIRHYVGYSESILTGKAKLKSADTNNDGEINIIDISSAIIGLTTGSLLEDVRPNIDNPRIVGTITLSEKNGTTIYPNTKTVYVSTISNGRLSATSSDKTIADASIYGNTLTIKPWKAGTVTITVTSAATEKYTAATVTYNLTIQKAAGLVTPPTARTGLTYTGSAQVLINSGSSTTGTMYYKLEGGTYSTSLPTAKDVGTYKIYYYSKGDTNHNDTAEGYITVTIAGPYKSYLVGQEVSVGGENFYVIEASDSLKSTVTLLAKYNLNKAGTAQLPDADGINTAAKFSSSYFWEFELDGYDWSKENFNINTSCGGSAGDAIWKAYDYALGKGGTNGRLLTFREACGLPDDIANGSANRQSNGEYYLNYWTSTCDFYQPNKVYAIFGGVNGFSAPKLDYSTLSNIGVRPVITIDKSKIS